MTDKQLELTFWKILNGVCKFIGWWFLVLGGIMAIFGLIFLIKPNLLAQTTRVYGEDVFVRIIAFILPATYSILGWFLIKAKKYFPSYLQKLNEDDEKKPVTRRFTLDPEPGAAFFYRHLLHLTGFIFWED